MDESVKKEAVRLHKKYGYLAKDVVKEIKTYDQNDAYFWDCVIIALQNM